MTPFIALTIAGGANSGRRILVNFRKIVFLIPGSTTTLFCQGFLEAIEVAESEEEILREVLVRKTAGLVG